MKIMIKRVYENPDPGDGMRILVDRLWPRGLSREAAGIDHWARSISPSNELRKWYGHDPDRWEEFRKRYAAELDGNAADVETLLEMLAKGAATFLYSSKEQQFNNARALRLYMEQRGQKKIKTVKGK